jgi:Raf kinase inhibitor-like YbhB/YbcL family protein
VHNKALAREADRISHMFKLTSPAFETGQPIPKRHTREGENISPELAWSEPPPGTQSFALVLDDPDAPAPSFRHWVVYDIPAVRRHLPEGGSLSRTEENLPHAVNSFRNLHYDGPEPPAEHPAHTYRFRLFALGIPTLNLGREPRAAEVVDAVRENILSEAELTGTYKAGG